MTYHYTMCGLDYVYLQNGYRKEETDYGSGIAIEQADKLDAMIAMLVVTSPTRLRGQELRFLRAMADMSQAELANHLGVKRVTVARWESHATTPISGPADRVLRVLIAHLVTEGSGGFLRMVIELLSEISDGSPEDLVMTYRGKSRDDEPSLFPDGEDEEDTWAPTKAA